LGSLLLGTSPYGKSDFWYNARRSLLQVGQFGYGNQVLKNRWMEWVIKR